MRFFGIDSYEHLVETIDKIYEKITNSEDEISDFENEVLFSIMDIVDESVKKQFDERRERVKDHLTTQGHGYVNFYGDKLPDGCNICLHGTGFQSVGASSTCNLRCDFCYYDGIHNEGWKIQDNHYLINDKLVNLDELKIHADKQIDETEGVAWVYEEPFMKIEKHYEPIKYLHGYGVYQWMYTNGTLCTKENIDKLAEAGLDELRFDLASTNCSDKVLTMMEYAVTKFHSVGIESPMIPEYLESFINKKDRIIKSGIDFINCAEVHYATNNKRRINKE